MEEKFKIIAITREGHRQDEVSTIISLLSRGVVDYVHLRKPDFTLQEMDQFLRSIPSVWHPRLRLHDHFSLTSFYDIGGIHLNMRNPKAPEGVKSITKSCHSIEQLEESEHFEYVTLSPIFDSISKNGYRSAFDINDIKPVLVGRVVVALGGVTPDKFGVLKEAGFSGAALSGYFFK